MASVHRVRYARQRAAKLTYATVRDSMFHDDARVVLSGDTLVTEDLRTGAAGPPQFPHVSYNGADRRVRRTIEALRDVGDVTLLPGHGAASRGELGPAIDAELAR